MIRATTTYFRLFAPIEVQIYCISGKSSLQTAQNVKVRYFSTKSSTVFVFYVHTDEIRR